MIDRDKWLKGQQLEREWHDKHGAGEYEYCDTYRQYFEYVGLPPFGSDVVEVGPADYPALYFGFGFNDKYVIEPLPSKQLRELCGANNIKIIKKPAEEVDWPEVDEVLLFNVLQHVLDPDIVIEKAKESANTIRFFEPINLPKDEMHHHSFILDDYRNYFGDCVELYKKNRKAENFHQWTCAYGVWRKNNG